LEANISQNRKWLEAQIAEPNIVKSNRPTPNDQGPPKRGRPAVYSNSAERARAWRIRQKELLAKAKTSQSNIEIGQPEHFKEVSPPKIKNIVQAFDDSFRETIGGEEKAQRLRALCSNSANNVRTILAILHATPSSATPHSAIKELQYLQDTANFLDELHLFFSAKEKQTKKRKQSARVVAEQNQQKQVEALIHSLFCSDSPLPAAMDSNKVTSMAQQLLDFASPATQAKLAAKRGVMRCDFFLENKDLIARSLAVKNIPKLAGLIAQNKLYVPSRGIHYVFEGQSAYNQGWDDFVQFSDSQEQKSRSE
jgi:hypothetical protein